MPYLRNQDVRWGRVNIINLPIMDFDDHERQKFDLRSGDVLVCEGGEIGRTAVWEGSLDRCSYQKAVHRLRSINGDVDPYFFAYHMMNAFLVSKLYGDTGTTTTIAHLPAVKLRSLPMPVPPLDTQHEIVRVIQSVDGKLQSEIARAEALRTLFQTLLVHLMCGAIRATGDHG